jgi:hypothetical protein
MYLDVVGFVLIAAGIVVCVQGNLWGILPRLLAGLLILLFAVLASGDGRPPDRRAVGEVLRPFRACKAPVRSR